MIYHLLVLFNSILFFLVPFFAPNGAPIITTNFPSSMVIDQEAVLEIKISKAEISGFATFQMDLPDGFVPREIENAGALFSINEAQLVWTWNELPEEEEMVISIGITPNSVAYGKKSIGASFYYIENNEKKSKDIVQTEITVLKEGETELAANTVDHSPSAQSTTAVESHSEPAGLVEVFYGVSDGAIADEKKVDITIKKGITKGFARFSDKLEAGFSARAVKTDGSSFSIADGKIKFVWVSVPEKEELKVSYILIRRSTAEELVLNGEYSYLEHNQSKKVMAITNNIRFLNSSELSQNTTSETKEQSAIREKPLKENEPSQDAATLETQLETQAKKQQNPTNFAVQIGAFNNSKVNAQLLKRKFKLQQNVRSEFQEGFSKFMFGSYAEYKTARKQREQTVKNNGIKSAFVVAYNNGKRISVQEALMVLNQKWFK